MNDLFAEISKKNKEKILYTLEANTIIFKKNSSLLTSIIDKNILAIILSGNLQIIKNDESGNLTLIEELTDDNIFASSFSHLNNDENDIIAKEETKLIIIDYNRILTLENKTQYYNIFIKNLLKIITEKINQKNERIDILTKKTVRDKLLEYFKIATNKTGTKIIYIPTTYKSFANYLAVDRSAMNRELKNLIDEGFIKKENKKITLLY